MKDTRTFRADTWAYAIWGGLIGIPLIPLVLCLVKFGWTGFLTRNLFTPTFLVLSALAILFFWLSRFRLEFGPLALSYRQLFGPSWTMPYSDITAITISRSTPIEQLPIGAYVQSHDGGKRLVYLKIFPRAAAKELFALAEEHESTAAA